MKFLESGIVEIRITETMLNEAKRLAEQNYTHNRFSLLGQEESKRGNIIGSLGEVMFQHVFLDAQRMNDYNFDFILDEKLIDIKTKSCNTVPQLDFDVSIFAYSIDIQKCSHYVFCRVLQDFSIGWIVGGISKVAFKLMAEHYDVGDTDLSNGFTFRKECYNLKIEKLEQLANIIMERKKINENK